MAAALDIHGSNPIALHRISQAAAVVRQELAERDSKRREEEDQKRHARIDAQLSELKKPHWTVLPNFWLTFLGAIAAVVAAYLAWLALRK
jgi:hypothetical protein